MAFFSQRLSQIFFVEFHHIGIFVRDANRFVGVDGVQGPQPGPQGFLFGAPGLAAAADATARTGHHLDEMQVLASRPDLIQEAGRIAQAVDHGHAQLHAIDLDLGFLGSLEAADSLTSRLPISFPVTRK